MNIVEATDQHIFIIQALSKQIWPHTFKDILSPQQIEYMMHMMYSTSALQEQINKKDHKYLLVEEDGEYLGYISYQINYTPRYITKIHKIYVLPTTQGKGIGRFLIDNVSQIALNNKNNILQLNVNKYNKAVKFYQHLGFNIDGEDKIDIGNGFIMDDYILTKKVAPNQIL